MRLMTHQGARGNGVNFSEVVIAKFQTGHVSLLELEANCLVETLFFPPCVVCFVKQRRSVRECHFCVLLKIQTDQQHNSLLYDDTFDKTSHIITPKHKARCFLEERNDS